MYQYTSPGILNDPLANEHCAEWATNFNHVVEERRARFQFKERFRKERDLRAKIASVVATLKGKKHREAASRLPEDLNTFLLDNDVTQIEQLTVELVWLNFFCTRNLAALRSTIASLPLSREVRTEIEVHVLREIFNPSLSD